MADLNVLNVPPPIALIGNAPGTFFYDLPAGQTTITGSSLPNASLDFYLDASSTKVGSAVADGFGFFQFPLTGLNGAHKIRAIVTLTAGPKDFSIQPYDGQPEIAEIYSFQRGIAAYTGPAIRIAKASAPNGATFDVPFRDDLIDIVAMKAWLGNDTAVIKTWFGQKAGANLTVSGTQTLAFVTDIGGAMIPAVRFPGGGDSYLFGSNAVFSLVKGAHVALRFNSAADTAVQSILTLGTDSAHLNRNTVAGKLDYQRPFDGGTVRSAFNSPADTDFHVVGFSHETSTPTVAPTVFLDGVQPTATVTGTPSGAVLVVGTQVKIGNNNASPAAQQFAGDIAEIVFYGAAPL